MSEKEFDLVVIGAGPGGYVAAIRAAQLKMKVAIIEEKHLGGVCLNWGCIPTKALLKISELKHSFDTASNFGFKIGKVDFDLKKVVNHSRSVADKLSSGINFLMKKNNIEVISGRAKFSGRNLLKITDIKGNDCLVKAKHIIIATGARARNLPNLQSNGKTIVTYKEAMIPNKMPKSILILGSGAIGIEFASFYQNMGVKVTVVELQDRILPLEDKEISNIALKNFKSQGMEIYTKSSICNVKETKDALKVDLLIDGKEKTITVERIIVAVGIVANTENLGLEAVGVELEKGHIKTDLYGKTNIDNIYAIGDVAGAPWLAHKASHEAVICVEKIAGLKVKPIKKENIPACTYCRPQIASVGLTEEKALDSGHEIRVGRFNYLGNGKAIAIGEIEGLVKVIFDKNSGELLGAHIIGAEATEMISSYLVGKNVEAVAEDYIHTIYPHPTLSEMMHEAVLDAYGMALHK